MPFRKTTDHEEIKLWVESHGGRPAAIRTLDGDLGVVRIDYSLNSDRIAGSVRGDRHRGSLTGGLDDPGTQQPLTWDEFFEQFENRKLAFIYDDEVPPGFEERSAKLVNRGS